jgi:replicative DNA helicase
MAFCKKSEGKVLIIDKSNSNLVYLEEYLRLVKDKFIRRSLIKLGYEAINSGYITNIPLENMLILKINYLISTMKLRHKII